MKFASTVILSLLLLATATTVDACCKRKGDFGCCGKGPCNVFCCNCDHGCNEQCEKTSCDSVQWLECAAIVAKCVASCADIAAPSCASCMGGSYNTCKGCYSSAIVEKKAYDGDDDRVLLPMDVDSFHELLDQRTSYELYQDASFDVVGFVANNTFESFDTNGDGILSPEEQGCVHEADDDDAKVSDV